MTGSRGWFTTFLSLVALLGLTSVVPGVARAQDSSFGRRATATTAPPTQAPARIEARGRTGRVELNWSEVRNAGGYRVFRGSGTTWTPIANVRRSRFEDMGLTNGVRVAYKVAALNRAGVGPMSAEVSATPLAPPTGLTATPGSQQITLTWTPSTGATGYIVLRSVGDTRPQQIATPAAPPFVDTGLTNGTLYNYRVRATAPNSVSASARVSATPGGTTVTPPATAPTVTATGGTGLIDVSWTAVTGATSYKVFRIEAGVAVQPPLASVTTTTFRHQPLAAGTTVSYKVAAANSAGDGPLSSVATATTSGVAPTVAPTVTAVGGDSYIDLTWNAVAGATGYKVFRVASGAPVLPARANVTTTSFRHQPLTNGTAMSYQVVATNASGDGPLSNVASATPVAPPVAPTNVRAVAGDGMVTLTWTAVPGATSYKMYRGTSTNGQNAAALTPDPTTASFFDGTVTNGTTYFYKVTAVAGGMESPRSTEVSATPMAAASQDVVTLSAFRLLRQATWGPKPGDVDRVKTQGAAAFVDEQLNIAPSVFPDTLFAESVEAAQEQWMHFALSGPDQLRQRVAWALHKIMVVSAADAAVNRTTAIVPYYRLMLEGAFGTYRNLVRSVTLNAAMGRYLNMLNNRKQTFDVNGVPTSPPPNENYARELLQLFTWGTAQLNPDGTFAGGVATPTYSEDDVKALARIFTGWTFGDGNPATVPTSIISNGDYRNPMEPVEGQHDRLAKTFMGEAFPADVDARTELEHVLDVIFRHPNTAPFISRQLIQQLVTSNPRPQYVGDIAAVFTGTGGNLGAVVRAILLHNDARGVLPTPAKLSEPVLFSLSILRGLNATVTDFPFLSDLTPQMGQNVFFPGSVFSYFSPGYRIPDSGTPPLVGPEFQILTSVTALERANFVGRLLAGSFGTAVTIDYAPFTALAATPDQLIESVNQLFMGGRMSATERARINTAVLATTDARERVRTALYVTVIAAQAQVDQ